MPRLSVDDCEILLRALEERPLPSSQAVRAVTRLRQRLEQTKAGGAGSGPDQTGRANVPASIHDRPSSCTLHVCTSCRPAGAPREPAEMRPGFILYQQLRAAVESGHLGARVDVRAAECLSICPRPCGIALSSGEAWTYLFGDQQPGETVEDVLECVSLYLDSTVGVMAREQRPKSLRASILGRVPPQGGQACT